VTESYVRNSRTEIAFFSAGCCYLLGYKRESGGLDRLLKLVASGLAGVKQTDTAISNGSAEL
jgi:hypothetical protein